MGLSIGLLAEDPTKKPLEAMADRSVAAIISTLLSFPQEGIATVTKRTRKPWLTSAFGLCFCRGTQLPEWPRSQELLVPGEPMRKACRAHNTTVPIWNPMSIQTMALLFNKSVLQAPSNKKFNLLHKDQTRKPRTCYVFPLADIDCRAPSRRTWFPHAPRCVNPLSTTFNYHDHLLGKLPVLCTKGLMSET